MNFGWVNISFQLIFPNAVFFLFTSHVLFPFPVYARYSTSKCLAYCTTRLQGNSEGSNFGTFLECRNLLRLIFSVLILTTTALAALQRLLCIISVYFFGFGQISYNSPPVFPLTRPLHNAQEFFCFDASLMVAFARPASCVFALCLEFHSLHFPFFLFALLHLVASLVAILALSLSFMFL